MAEVEVAKVTSKGQMTIPQSVREELGIRPGDYLVMRTVAGAVLLAKAELKSPALAEELLRSLVVRLGRELEERGGMTEEELDWSVKEAQHQACLEPYGQDK